MAETDRSFRKFMTDPKTAVMHYIAENLPSTPQSQGHAVGTSNGTGFNHAQFTPHSQQQQQTTADIAPVNQLGQPLTRTEPSQPSGMYQQYGSSQLGPVQGNALSTEWVSRPSSTPGVEFAQPPPQLQANLNTYSQPWINQHARTEVPGPSPAGTGIPIQPNGPGSSKISNVSGLPNQVAFQARKPPQSLEMHDAFGIAPPSTPIRQTNTPSAVSRAYHRMILEYEKTKMLFFAASAENNAQIVSQSTYQLECLALQIWSFRRERALEFEGYSTAEHAIIILDWHTKYAFWADTVLDFQEGVTVPDGLIHSGEAQQQNLNTYMSRLQLHSPSPVRNEQGFIQQTDTNAMMEFQGHQDANNTVVTSLPQAMSTPGMYQSQMVSQNQQTLTLPNIQSLAMSGLQSNSHGPPAVSQSQQTAQSLPTAPQSQIVQKVQQQPAPQTYVPDAPSQKLSQNMYAQGSSALSPNANGRLLRPQSNNMLPASVPNGIGTRPDASFGNPSQGRNAAVRPGPVMN